MANEIEITVKTRKTGTGLKDLDDGMAKAEKSSGRLSGALKNVGTVAAGFLAANVIQSGLSAFTGFLGESIDLAKEQTRVESQLNAVIKSTGSAAGLTAQEIKDMASGFQEVTNFGDEATIASSNVLLTFTKIGNETFPRAQEAILDISAALGQDLQQSTVQVGKALNDPIAGVGALSRVGVQFTEQQKEQIKTMAEAGDTAGAQAVILAELETQFKGSAAAAVEADGGIQQAENAMGDLQEQIGVKLIPIMAGFKRAQLAVVSVIVDKFLPAASAIWDALSPAILAIKDEAIPVLRAIGDQIGMFFNALSSGQTEDEGTPIERIALRIRDIALFLIDEVLPKVREGIDLFFNAFKSGQTEDEGTPIEELALALREFVTFLIEDVVPIIEEVVPVIGEVFMTVLPVVVEVVGQIISIVASFVELITAVLSQVVEDINTVWAAWGEEITALVTLIWDVVVGLIRAALDIIQGLIVAVTGAINGDWEEAWEGIKQIFGGIWDAILVVLEGALTLVVLSLSTAWDLAKDTVVDALVSIKDNVASIWDSVITTLTELPGRVQRATSGLWNGITDSFKAAINRVIGAWNDLEFSLPSVSIPGLGDFGGGTLRTPNVSKLATGGISRGLAQGLSLINESGGELVKLPNGTMVSSAPDSQRILSQQANRNSGPNLTLIVNGPILAERDLNEIIREILERSNSLAGLDRAFA